MNQWTRWETEKRVAKAAAALQKNGFAVEVVETLAEAAGIVSGLAEGAVTVGFGGSVTAAEAGLPGLMAGLGKKCLIHSAPGLTPEERLEVMRGQLVCDLFISGANSVTLDGKIVNIDATGNRVGAMAFGPKKIVILAGANKLTADAGEAVKRVRDIASPANSHRLSYETPCSVTGFCSDCNSPQRICRIVHIMEKRPRLSDITVILTLEHAGL